MQIQAVDYPTRDARAAFFSSLIEEVAALVVSMGNGVPMEIVGIVGDARLTGVRIEGDAAFYMSAAQMGATQLRLAVRTGGRPGALAGPIREILRRKDHNALLSAEVPMSRAVADTLSTFRVVVAFASCSGTAWR